MRNILVLGADGLIGSAIYSDLNSSSEVNIVGTSRRLNSKHIFYDLKTSLPSSLPDIKFDVVFVCSAITSLEYCELNPELSHFINVSQTLNFIKYWMDRGAYVVFISSSTVFDGEKYNPLPNDLPNPISQYGLQKYAVENYLKVGGGSFLIIRLTKVITAASGIGLKLKNIFFNNGDSISLYKNLLIAPISIDFAVQSIICMTSRCSQGIYHLSSNFEISYFELARLFATSNNLNVDLIRGEMVNKHLLYAPRHPALGMNSLDEIKPQSQGCFLESFSNEII